MAENGMRDSELSFAESPVDSVDGTSPVRPGRTRSRAKDLTGEKPKRIPPAAEKKPPVRKAPARGRFVDEYARPAGI